MSKAKDDQATVVVTMPHDPQQAWVLLASVAREQLAVRANGLNKASAEEVDLFFDSCLSAIRFEREAQLFDKRIANELQKLYCDEP